MKNAVVDALCESRPVAPVKSAVLRKKLLALDALLEGDEREQRATFNQLKRALNAERGSDRKLFS